MRRLKVYFEYCVDDWLDYFHVVLYCINISGTVVRFLYTQKRIRAIKGGAFFFAWNIGAALCLIAEKGKKREL